MEDKPCQEQDGGMTATLRVCSVDDLRSKRFVIPSFQRGYRWRETEVEALLEDIDAFVPEQEQNYYLLQPIVIKKNALGAAHGEVWDVIDGQQRLTTIKIILEYLGEKSLTIEYETRPSSQGTDFFFRHENRRGRRQKY